MFFSEGNSYYEKLPDGRVVCIDEEIPFEVPKGWNWERFGNLVFNRDSERIPLSVSERNSLSKKYDYYGASGVIDKVDRPLFHTPLLLIGEDGANLINRSTPIAFIAKGEYWVNNHAHVIDSKDLMELEYLCLYINAIPLTPYVTGTAQPKMNQEKMNSILVAVPPIEEQKRIVKKYSVIEPIISRFTLAQRRMDKLNDDIYEKLRKSILQDAIQGHLVAQDLNDEPASLLIVRISTEKQRMLKEGKLKQKDICDSVILKGEDNKYYENVGGSATDISEEIPFDIPKSWAWCRLGSVIMLQSGQDLVPERYFTIPNGIPYITGASNLANGAVLVNRWTNTPTSISHKGDLLITCKGTVGTMAYNTIGDIHIARQIMSIHSDWILIEYIEKYLEYSIPKLEKAAHSIIPGISRETILTMLIPIPPLEEQGRILGRLRDIHKN
ncbi:MAG: restriction endonuclease subunit S [Bacteroidales bacterium]|nr:restriction endonuclease subunit S [Bacteroidales bacterium]